MPVLTALQSEKHIITLTTNGQILKLFQITFGKDGTVFVHFPYHFDTNGLTTVIKLDRALSYPANNISLTKSGKVTTHKVKFSHHPDGRAHFSQDTKVLTEIRKQATPLNSICGHFFTLAIQNPIGFFMQAKDPKDHHHYSQERSVINFEVNGHAKTFKFVAAWGPLEEIGKDMQPSSNSVLGPKVIRRPHPTPSVGFVLGQPQGYPFDGYGLTLCIEEVSELDSTVKRGLIMFIGGFDSQDVVNDHSSDTSFLALMYPTLNPQILKAQLGTIDLDVNPTVP